MAEPLLRMAPGASTALAVVRRTVTRAELAAAVPQCCGLAWNFAQARNLPSGRNVAVYWDDAIRLEAGVELHASFDEAEGIVRSATPAGPTASMTHLGSYGELGRTHEAIRRWCRDHHRRLAGPSWEIYGHCESVWTSNPARIRTDVFYQIVPD